MEGAQFHEQRGYMMGHLNCFLVVLRRKVFSKISDNWTITRSRPQTAQRSELSNFSIPGPEVQMTVE